MNISVESKGLDMRLPSEVEAGLFRWAQGAIGNIAQHSKAKSVRIILNRKNQELYIEIADDGIGFDVSKITDIDESGRGRGVFSMKERIGLLGGSCGIESKPGQGTTVWGRVPIYWGYQE